MRFQQQIYELIFCSLGDAANTRGHRAEGSVSQRGGPGGPDLLAGYERSSHSLYLYDHFHVLFFFASPKAYSFCCLFIFIAEGIFI